MAVNETTIGDKQAIIDEQDRKVDWLVKLDDISEWTFANLDTHIEGNVNDMAGAKLFLKKLGKIVLALTKLNKDKHY